MSVDSTGRDPTLVNPKEVPFIERTETDATMDIKWEELGEAGKLRGTQNITVHLDGNELKYTVTLSNISDKNQGAQLFEREIVRIVQVGIDRGIVPGSEKILKYSKETDTFTKLSADKTSPKKIEVFGKTLANREEQLGKLKNELLELNEDDTLESIKTLFDEIGNEKKSPFEEKIEEIEKSITKIQGKLETAKKLENLFLQGSDLPSTPEVPLPIPTKKMRSEFKKLDELINNLVNAEDADNLTEIINSHFREPAASESSRAESRLGNKGLMFLDNFTKHEAYSKLSEIKKKNIQSILRQNHTARSTSLINDFVSEFLNPYLTGAITPENEDKDRKSMMELLFEKFNIDDSKKELITNLAFDAYIQKSATLLVRTLTEAIQSTFQHSGVDEQRSVLKKSYETEISLLVNSLTSSLTKDFPGKKFDRSELENKVFEAFFSLVKADMAYLRDMAPTSSGE